MARTGAVGMGTTVQGQWTRTAAIGAVALALGAGLLDPADAAARAIPRTNTCNELSHRIDVAVDNRFAAEAAGNPAAAKFYDQQATVLGREYQAFGC